MDYGACVAACKALVVVAVPSVTFTHNEALYLPVLRSEVHSNWPNATNKSAFAAQVNQETCASLKSKKCWSPTAELKTDREYGFGLGQLTVTSRFDNFKEARKLHPTLKDWTWENRYNATYQLRTMILMDKFAHGKFDWAENEYERMAFSFAAYNGGIGGVLSDRTVCRTVHSCNAARWFGNVEHTSKKAKVASNGYGQGFFQINRSYVKNVMDLRRARYTEYFGEQSVQRP